MGYPGNGIAFFIFGQGRACICGVFKGIMFFSALKARVNKNFCLI